MPAPGEQHVNHGGKPIQNPFEEVQPRMSEYTAQEIATLQSRLEKQLGPEYISSRAGPSGHKVHYIAAEKCIQLANEVFGFNGWSSQIMNLQVDFMDEHPSTLKVSLGLSVIVRVTLKDGSFHEDIGYGHIENCKGKAAAFEKAKKEGTTDGLKRALRNFGNVLGNCIYDKDYLSKVTKVKIQPSKWDAESLYRHSDYATVRKGPEAPEPEKNQSLNIGSESLDDEFGDFDDTFADFVPSDPDVHPDEVVLPGPHVPSHRGNGGVDKHTALNGKPMPTSIKPQIAPRALNPPAKTNNFQSNQPPKTPNGALVRTSSGAGAAIGKGQDAASNPVRVQPVNGGPPRVLNQPSRNSVALAPTSPSHSLRPLATPEDDDLLSVPTGAIGVGFLSAKAAELLPRTGDGPCPVPVLPNLPTFNPHAESPSIRRTPGIDHNSSKPLSREGKHVPGSTQQPSAGQGMRPHIINPQLDTARRIGAPGSPSPMANRSSYKPPTMKRTSDGANVQRLPLNDVATNQPITIEGGGDVKRQKMHGV